MSNFSLKNLCKAAFNMSSFGALGGACLSVAMGGWGGVALFGGAALLGVRNKYIALQRVDGVNIPEPETAVGRFLSRPEITAEAIMLGATYNVGDSAGQMINDVISNDGQELLVDGLKTFGWGMAVLADNALRRLDQINFSNVQSFVHESKSKFVNAFNAASLNPTVFYNLSNLSFVAALINQEKMPLETIVDDIQPGNMDGFVSGTALGALGLGVGCAVRGGRQLSKFIQGAIPKDEMNDNAMVVMGGLLPLALGMSAVVSQEYMMATSQFIFSGVLMSSIPETSAAIKKQEFDIK